jgi:hypothetical protein
VRAPLSIVGPTRRALAATVRRAKRNKAFRRHRWVGRAIDGTGAGYCRAAGCANPCATPTDQVLGYLHHFVMISVVGTDLALPFDVEHVTGAVGVRVVARLKDNLPTVLAAAEARFTAQPPTLTWAESGERLELWDADDFDPWETRRWPTVRVLRYRQHKADGTVVEAYWLTDLPVARVSSRLLYRFAKSRWEIENEGFNDGKPGMAWSTSGTTTPTACWSGGC